MRLTMRISVGVSSRPSMRVCNLPCPPNSVSITWNTRFGSNTMSPVPRSGLTCTRLRLAGTARLRRNSLYRSTRTGATEISTLRRVRLASAPRSARAKRSCTSSSVGMRPRTTRSCRPMS